MSVLSKLTDWLRHVWLSCCSPVDAPSGSQLQPFTVRHGVFTVFYLQTHHEGLSRNKGAAAGAPDLALGPERAVHAWHHCDHLLAVRAPDDNPAAQLGPRLENVDDPSLLEVQTHRSHPGAATGGSPFCVKGSEHIIKKTKTQRVKERCPSHMAEKRAAGTSPGVWLAACGRATTAVQVGSWARDLGSD